MKDIKGYEGLYAITSCGRVWSYKRKTFLKPADNGQGYLQVVLSKDGKRKHYRIHRLVAEAYIPNPENKTDVNHIDEFNKANNSINNLEWMTREENLNYGTRSKRSQEKHKGYREKAVFCVEKNKSYPSISAAARELGITSQAIGNCLNGKQKTSGGYHWEFI